MKVTDIAKTACYLLALFFLYNGAEQFIESIARFLGSSDEQFRSGGLMIYFLVKGLLFLSAFYLLGKNVNQLVSFFETGGKNKKDKPADKNTVS